MASRHILSRQTLADQIADRLRTDILSGQFPVGSLLPSQRELAADFGTSTNVVREALRTLQAQGLIEIRHGSGMYVTDLPARASLEDVDLPTLVEARCMLEVGAIHAVIENIDAEGFSKLEEIVRRAALKVAAGQSVIDEELAFHRALLELSGNAAVAHLGRVIDEFFQKVLANVPHEDAGRYPPFVAEHMELIEIIRKGDVPAARKALRDHITSIQKERAYQQQPNAK